MAHSETIIKAFAILRSRYPNYFRNNADIKTTMSVWQNEFKNVRDDTFLQAINLICASSAYFPNPAEVRDKVQRAEWIVSQRIATYLGRLETYNQYKGATQSQIDTWVDVHRFVDDSKGWTTKDFREMVETFKEQLNESIRALPDDYKAANGIKEV